MNKRTPEHLRREMDNALRHGRKFLAEGKTLDEVVASFKFGNRWTAAQAAEYRAKLVS